MLVKGATDSKVHGANMGLLWGRQDSGGPDGGPMNFAIWDTILFMQENPESAFR